MIRTALLLASFLAAIFAVQGAFGQNGDAAYGQQEDAIMQRTIEKMRANIETYVSSLPNIDCEEHVRSAELKGDKLKREITLDSTVRATRQPDADEFKEERTHHAMNGKTLNKLQNVTLPLSIAGGFGNSFAPYFALKYEQCHNYALQPSKNDKKTLIEVTGRLENYQNRVCSEFTETRARFWLDANSAQILRMESVSPHAGERIGFNTLTITTEYALVPLGEKPYLLPVRVHALLTRNKDDIAVRYDAQYSQCRRFGATVEILPTPSEAPAGPQ